MLSLFIEEETLRFRERISKLPEVIHVDMVEWAFNPVGLAPESTLLITTLACPCSRHDHVVIPSLCQETRHKVMLQFLKRAHNLDHKC